MEKALAGRGDTALDSATFNKAEGLLNFSIGPNTTYNELANKLDSMIREFRLHSSEDEAQKEFALAPA